jgi:hypothetical protein
MLADQSCAAEDRTKFQLYGGRYVWVAAPKSWQEAQDLCSNTLNMSLVTVYSAYHMSKIRLGPS